MSELFTLGVHYLEKEKNDKLLVNKLAFYNFKKDITDEYEKLIRKAEIRLDNNEYTLFNEKEKLSASFNHIWITKLNSLDSSILNHKDFSVQALKDKFEKKIQKKEYSIIQTKKVNDLLYIGDNFNHEIFKDPFSVDSHLSEFTNIVNSSEIDLNAKTNLFDKYLPSFKNMSHLSNLVNDDTFKNSLEYASLSDNERYELEQAAVNYYSKEKVLFDSHLVSVFKDIENKNTYSNINLDILKRSKCWSQSNSDTLNKTLLSRYVKQKIYSNQLIDVDIPDLYKNHIENITISTKSKINNDPVLAATECWALSNDTQVPAYFIKKFQTDHGIKEQKHLTLEEAKYIAGIFAHCKDKEVLKNYMADLSVNVHVNALTEVLNQEIFHTHEFSHIVPICMLLQNAGNTDEIFKAYENKSLYGNIEAK